MDPVNKFSSPVLGSSLLRYRSGQAAAPGTPDSGVGHDLSPARSIGAWDYSDASDCEQEAASASASSVEKRRRLLYAAVTARGAFVTSHCDVPETRTALSVLVAVVMLSSCAFTLLMMTRGMAVEIACSEADKVAMYAERNGKYASMAFAAASANGPEPDVASTKPDVAASEPDRDLVKDEDDPFRFRKDYF